MNVLSIYNIRKAFGDSELFHDVSLAVGSSDRIAIVGANGTGKTTLLKMILGLEEISREHADGSKGAIVFAKGIRYGYLSQDVIESLDHTLEEEAMLVFRDLIAMEAKLSELANQYALHADDQVLASQYGRLLNDFENRGGYDYHYRVAMMLSKFGFSEEVRKRPISSFSGGERTKMAFVKLLLLEPELLILDEPTNHLDVSTIDWLENYLKTYHGAILFVSHDRYFINEVASKVAELDQKELVLYKGNYDEYIRQKTERTERLLKEYTLQQREIEKLKQFIAFYKPKPRFVSRAKDREKKLEHLKKIDKPQGDEKAIRFHFDGAIRPDKKIIYFDQCSVGFETPLVAPFSFYLFGQDKLAIMGDNGTGKTTLLRSLMQEAHLYGGQIHRLMPLSIGYVRQNDFDWQEDRSLLDHFVDEFPALGEKVIRNHLGKFAFTSDEVFKSIAVLSGGEKMRALLAQIVLKRHDVLLLDEPTNHLDLLTREALIKAMQDYEGCLIFVSHDRYFVDSVANKILYFAHGTPFYHEGNYESFKIWENGLIHDDSPTPTVKTSSKLASSKAEDRKRQNWEKELHEIEKQLDVIKEAEWQEENYLDYRKMEELAQQRQTLESRFEELWHLLYEA